MPLASPVVTDWTGQQLVLLAVDSMGVERDQYTEIARRLGLARPHADRRVKRWVNGDNEPDYEGTMALLAYLQMLREQNTAEVIAATERAREALARQPADPLAELRVTVEEQGKAMTKALKALERANRDLARRLPPEAPAAKKAV